MCYNKNMTLRKNETQHREIGNLIRKHRASLTDLPKSRQGFIEDRSQKFFDCDDWISENTLCNYENGKNIPSLENIRNLSIALEIDELELVKEILDLL